MEETVLLAPNQGEKTKITGFDAVYRTALKTTGNLLDYFELKVPPKKGAPWHIHHKNDESLHVIKGEFIFHIGNKEYKAPKGTFLFLPKGVAHKFTNIGTTDGVMIGTFTPAGTFSFFDKLTKLSPDDFEEIQAYSRKYGHEVLEKGSY